MPTIKTMIGALKRAGMTQVGIAGRTRVQQAVISRVMSGAQKDVLYEAGKRIERLYAKKVQK